MHPLVDRMVEIAERPGPGGRSLADRLRASYDAHVGTYDGYLVDELIAVINALIDETAEEQVRDACNTLGEQEGFTALEEGEFLLGPYADMFIDPVLEEINRGNKMNRAHSLTPTLTVAKIVRVMVNDDTLAVDLEDGRTIAVPIGWFPRLAYGTPAERANFQISGAGCGIHWPDLDEDIGIEGLILGKKSTESQASLARWLQGRQSKTS
jgi:hypothetical protein